MNGFYDETSKVSVKGYVDLCEQIIDKFPEPTEIIIESEKKSLQSCLENFLSRIIF